MAIATAITALKDKVAEITATTPGDEPNQLRQGNRLTSAVWWSGSELFYRGRVERVSVEILRPPSRDWVTQDDIRLVLEKVSDLYDFLDTKEAIGGYIVYWPQGVSSEFDYSDGAAAYVTIPLCTEYPRSAS